MPAWLHTDNARNEAYVVARRSVLADEESALRAQLSTLDHRHELRTALGDAARLQWVLENVRALETGDLFCWITGWTSEFAGHRLASALDRSGARSILHHPPPPPGAARTAAAREPMVGAAIRDLQPRAGHSVAQRGRPQCAARDRRAADVRLHVCRCGPGTRNRGRWLPDAQPLAACAPVHRGWLLRGRIRPVVRQCVQPARHPPPVDRPSRRSVDDSARSVDRRRRAADDRTGTPGRRGPLARRPCRLVDVRCRIHRGLPGATLRACVVDRNRIRRRRAQRCSAWATRGAHVDWRPA